MKNILIIGCGSIGERHLRCLLRTGKARIAACDTNTVLLQRLAKEYQVASFDNWNQALAHRFAGMAICTPAHTHIEIARFCLRKNAALLIEKPLNVGFEGVDE